LVCANIAASTKFIFHNKGLTQHSLHAVGKLARRHID
jgi:hypothetical protein